MTRALKDLVGIFVILTFLNDFVNLTPVGSVIFAELCVAMGVLVNSLVLSLKHQSIWLSQTLSRLNRRVVKLSLPLLMAAQLVSYAWYALDQPKGSAGDGVFRNQDCRKYLYCNFFVIVLLFCHLEEHGFYNKSMRLVLLWVCSLVYTLNYCNTTAEQTTLARLMKTRFTKTLLISGTLATLLMRGIRTVHYLYSSQFGGRHCKAWHPRDRCSCLRG